MEDKKGNRSDDSANFGTCGAQPGLRLSAGLSAGFPLHLFNKRALLPPPQTKAYFKSRTHLEADPGGDPLNKQRVRVALRSPLTRLANGLNFFFQGCSGVFSSPGSACVSGAAVMAHLTKFTLHLQLLLTSRLVAARE